MPSALSLRLTVRASSRVSPATNRVERRRAREEVSIHLRNLFRRERNRKTLRTNSRLTPLTLGKDGLSLYCKIEGQSPHPRQAGRGTMPQVLWPGCRAVSPAGTDGLADADVPAHAQALPRLRAQVLRQAGNDPETTGIGGTVRG